jgi:methylglutaconyl-CoA hydratase
MSRSSTPLVVESHADVLRLTINSPETRNALSESGMIALAEAIRATRRQRELRAIVITGAGDKAFCAGANLKPGADAFGFDYATPNTVYADLLREAKACTLPMIARVNGHCLAGGMGILAMCNMAVAVETAQFGLPETRVGLFPMQVAALLKDIIPKRKFEEMCLTGEPVTAPEALSMGLINYVVPSEQLDSRVDWLLARIIAKSPTAIRRGKYALSAMEHMTYEEALAYAEAQIGTMLLTEDAVEGLAAFNDKRSPNWTGR